MHAELLVPANRDIHVHTCTHIMREGVCVQATWSQTTPAILPETGGLKSAGTIL